MSPPPGVAVYAKDLAIVARFYASVAGLGVVEEAEGHVALASDTLDLVVVRIPAELAEEISISSPPARREKTPIKPLLPVDSIAATRPVAAALGGVVDPAEREWRWQGSTVCDGHDPEGNVFQLRERRD